MGTSVSGEVLAQECSVSRAAIWKAVKGLREQGYAICGTTNGGYMLGSEPDIVSEDTIRKNLVSLDAGLNECHIEAFKEIDSTNTYAKRLLSVAGSMRDPSGQLTEAGKTYHKAIFVAESQSAGRGRLGRTFVSPLKTGIYMSLVYAPLGGITEPAKLTAFAAVAVKRVIDRLFGVSSSIKWINDIFVQGKKVCGILTEGFTNFETGRIESAIVGIGINISDNAELFEKSGSPIVGSITGNSENADSTGVSRSQLAAEIAAEAFKVFEEDVSLAMSQYKDASLLTGKTVEVHPIIGNEDSYYNATVIGIADDASLMVRLENGEVRSLSSGEVSLHGSVL